MTNSKQVKREVKSWAEAFLQRWDIQVAKFNTRVFVVDHEDETGNGVAWALAENRQGNKVVVFDIAYTITNQGAAIHGYGSIQLQEFDK